MLQTKPNQTKPNQTKPDQTNPDQYFFFRFLLCIFLLICITYSCTRDENLTSSHQEQIDEDEYFVSLEEASLLVHELEFEKPYKGDYLKGKSIENGSKKIKASKSFPDQKGIAAGHIFNFEEGGFVIISADKRTEALLAFSDDNEFSLDLEAVPPGPRGWLSMVSDGVSELRTGKYDSEDFKSLYQGSWLSEEIENALSDRKSYEFSKTVEPNATACYYPGYPPGCTSICQDTYYTKGPLLQSLWGQRDGFNNLLPHKGCSTTNNGRALTGCIPIAMAQVMRYHQQPSSRYNFSASAMPLGTSGSSEISRLVRDIGNTLNVTYGCNNTWVNPGVIDGGFGLYSYGGAIYENYDVSDYNIVKSNLDMNRPVLLEGKEKPLISFDFSHVWHVWVCDGYRTRYDCQNGIGYLFFHMNWGWNGNSNGWYGFNNWAPNGVNLKYFQHFAHNIKP